MRFVSFSKTPASWKRVAHSEAGMTIPELILGIAIASCVTVVSAQIVSNQMAGQVLTEARAEIASMLSEIQFTMANSQACKRTVGGKAPGDSVTNVYRVSRDESSPGRPWKEVVSHRVDPSSTAKVRLANLNLQGSIPANNTGELRLVARFEVNRDVIGVRVYERDIKIRAVMSDVGTVASCSGIEGDRSTRLLCSDPIVACADHPDYCREQVYVNQTEGCVCLGSRTVGSNVFGVPCDGAPSPTPPPVSPTPPPVSPTPTPTITPTPTPSVSPTPALLVDSQSLRNGTDSIIYDVKLNSIGRVHYAVYSVDMGVLTPADVKVAALTPPSGTLVAAGTENIADPATPATVTVSSLPDSRFYTFYAVAEGTPGSFDAVKRYRSVIPRRVSIQEIAVPAPANLIRYYLYYPVGHYDAVAPNPVLIYHHGAGETPNDASNNVLAFTSGARRMQKASVPAHLLEGRDLPFISISPQCNSAFFPCWNYSGAEDYIDAVVNTAKTALNADPKRIYMTGVSTGGTATWRFAMHAGSSLAAIAPFSTGTAATNALIPQICGGIAGNNVAVWAFHNANDTLIDPSRTNSYITRLNGCTPAIPPRNTTYTGTVWPASDTGFSPYFEDEQHDAVSYTLGTPYHRYFPSHVLVTAPTPLEPQFVSELNAISISAGKPVNSLWDWFLLHQKP